VKITSQLTQCLINALAGQVKLSQNHMSGNPTNQELTGNPQGLAQ